MSAVKQGIRPFSNGTQLGAWRARNCRNCGLWNPERFDGQCSIDEAIGLAYAGDGTVTEDVAQRMGYAEGLVTRDCPELQAAS
jgi:hypothetical protein